MLLRLMLCLCSLSMIPPKRFYISPPLTGRCSEGLGTFIFFFKYASNKTLNVSRPSEHPLLVRGGDVNTFSRWNHRLQRHVMFKEKSERICLDLLSIPQSGGKNVKTFRWDHSLQIQNLFMAFKRISRW